MVSSCGVIFGPLLFICVGPKIYKKLLTRKIYNATILLALPVALTAGGLVMSKRVTMSDVARQAGVSLMTVSRVINDKGDVSSETRERVLQIISALEYRPSGIARSLATKETCTIGLVVPEVSNPFFADITRGVEGLAYLKGYHVFLCNTEEDPQRELAVIQSLEVKRVDGLILCSSRLGEEKLVDILANMPPVVLINRRLHQTGEDNIDSVILDDERGGWISTHHLIQSGHQDR